MKNTFNNNKNQDWGGSWTVKKLDAFEKYVNAYLSIMEINSFWKTIYFDGFAGSGEVQKRNNKELLEQLCLIEEEQNVYRGAAERIVGLDKKFSFYYFIEKNDSAREKLKIKLIEKAPNLESCLVFKESDCNSQLNELATVLQKSKKYASLIFLDPFGMQIDWSTIAKLEGTRSDIWILIPTGVIVNRLLDKKGELKNINKLESFFGLPKEEILKEFYSVRNELTLFGDINETVTKVMDPINKISRLYAKNLASIWDFVTPSPLRLTNSNNVPIFHFIFASNNKNAVKIAQQIIDKIN